MYDCLIIGGGIIGLTIGRRFAKEGYKTIILEANKDIGLETTFRNSAVIHAGIYYPTDSLKAKLCVEGKDKLKSYCDHQDVSYQNLGKLIVATHENQLPVLEKLLHQGNQNGVKHLEIINKLELSKLEPAISGVAALFSPETAVVDGSCLIRTLKNDILSMGGAILTNTCVTKCWVEKTGFRVNIHPQDHMIQTRCLINAAGLYAQAVAQNIVGLLPNTIPPTFYAKGNYFKYSKTSPFSHLIYPVPEKAGLGIHATLDLNKKMRFGPDVEWVDEPDYCCTVSRREDFFHAIQSYFKDIKMEDLEPDDTFTGIRPKILPPNQQPQDFYIQDSKQHGIKNLVNLYGIESPGLTACFAIADYIFNLFVAKQDLVAL